MTINQFKELIINKRQVFLTGAGGVGKSYNTKLIRSKFDHPVTLASTNAAAILVGGDTVHSFFALGTASSITELMAEDRRYVEWFCNNVTDNPAKAIESRKNKIRKLVTKSDLIIIDEVSMISAKVFDLIYYRFKQCEVTPPPILLVGDLYQLPPVERNTPSYDSLIFNSENFNPYIVELTSIKRSTNPDFTRAMKSVRVGKYTEHAHKVIDSITNNAFDEHYNPTVLVATNKQADDINSKRLRELKTPEVHIVAEVETKIKDKRRIDSIIKDMPVKQTLTLKVGCRVMFVANDRDNRSYYNGLQGVVKVIPNLGCVVVETDTGKEITVGQQEFTKNKVELVGGEPVYVTELTMRQIPLRVCYALTIHKAQGASITQLEVDCDGMFERGQFYVAISRATDPKQIRLLNFKGKALVKNQVSLPEKILDSVHKIPEFLSEPDEIKINIGD